MPNLIGNIPEDDTMPPLEGEDNSDIVSTGGDTDYSDEDSPSVVNNFDALLTLMDHLDSFGPCGGGDAEHCLCCLCAELTCNRSACGRRFNGLFTGSFTPNPSESDVLDYLERKYCHQHGGFCEAVYVCDQCFNNGDIDKIEFEEGVFSFDYNVRVND